jgi:phosphate starvation-inducible PhoH-like protein
MGKLMKLDVMFHDSSTFRNVLGSQDRNLIVLSRLLQTQIFTKGAEIFVSDTNEADKQKLDKLFQILIMIASNNIKLSERDIIYIAKLQDEVEADAIIDLYLQRDVICKSFDGKLIYAKTFSQKEYLKAIKQNDLVFAVGPAGTGKTYVAVMHAIQALKVGKIKKLILTRPAVEAGENLGFLPGDLKEKIDPYLRPLYDALYEALGIKATEELIEKGVIEIAPLAYMRGRTLENAYVILDEAQNTKANQMKLFLTRLGFNSKMVVTGDITQIDLKEKEVSGLVHALKLLDDIDGIFIVRFSKIDVIRHPLVQKVLEKYEEYESKYR